VVIQVVTRKISLFIFTFALAAAFVAGALTFNNGGPPAAPAHAAPQVENPTDRPILSLRDLNNAFVDLAKQANPAVVTVFTEQVMRVRQVNPFGDFFGDFFGYRNQPGTQEREYRRQGLGSGVIVSADGYILTNNHVIAGADTINVRLMDGDTRPAKVVGADEKTDIAVLKVDEKNLPTMKIGDSDKLRVGEMVLAIGSPLSANLAHSVTSGIVSAKGRSNVGLADYEDFIQTDAAINPGNSGGALINLDGELVGINTAIASQSGGYQGIGFAVPSNMAQHVMESLIKYGTVTRGWIGLYIQDINESLASAMNLKSREGALIGDVAEDGPAQKAGLKQGDVIVSLDGQPVKNSTELRNDIASRKPGSKVDVKVLRDGKEKDFNVKLAELPADKVAKDVENKLEDKFGFSVAPFDANLAAKYNLNRSLEGVVITSVVGGGPAERAGLQEGDLIVEINRQPTHDLEQFNDQVRNLKSGSNFFLRVVRENRSFYVGFRL